MDKILTSEIESNYVKSVSGNKLSGTVTENKDVFDKFPYLVATKFNKLIDDLVATTGAGEISALNGNTASTVQGMINTFIAQIADRYTVSQSQAYVTEQTNSLVADVGIDLTTGVITITKKDGTVTSIDTALEKVPASFALVEEGTSVFLVVTNQDGTTSRTDVTSLLNVYSFNSGTDIQFTSSTSASGTSVSAGIKDASITKAKLSTTLVSYLEGLESSASTSANSASTSSASASSSKTAAANSATSAANSASAAASSAADSASSATASANSATSASTSATSASSSKSDVIAIKNELMQYQAIADVAEIYDRINAKENKAVYSQYTLLASNWANSQYSLETDYPTASYDISIGPADSMTDAQYKAWAAIKPLDSLSNIIKIKGKVPLVNLPVIIKAVSK